MIASENNEKEWLKLTQQYSLSDRQLEQFQEYAAFLLEQNKIINLTAITTLKGVVRWHFMDSLIVTKFFDFSKISVIADIGTGAGFPGIPLKILFPHLSVVLIEVTRKKQEFLAELLERLRLEDVEVCGLDWRTFLRKTTYNVDLFLTRATTGERELCRAFKPACRYNNVPIVYWVSYDWKSGAKEEKLVQRVEFYKLGFKKRKLAFLSLVPLSQKFVV